MGSSAGIESRIDGNLDMKVIDSDDEANETLAAKADRDLNGGGKEEI